MDLQETQKILSIVKCTYPQTYKNIDKNQAQNILMLWSDIFADYTLDDVSNALKYFIKTDVQGFAPSPGQLIDIITRKSLDAVHTIDASTAWTLL